ncbi:MAG: hypothetical protein QM771_16130 [Nitrospira sp.]
MTLKITAISALLLIQLNVGCGPNLAPTLEKRLANIKQNANIYTIRHEDKKNAILFVHGIFGDHVTTWVSEDGNAYWPTMIADDPDFDEFDIYSVGYDSPLFAQTSSLEQTSTALLNDLRSAGIFNKYQQLHFVTHSMGGLIAKRMTELVENQETEFDRIRSIVFIATPAQGASVNGLYKMFGFIGNPQLRAMQTALESDGMKIVENSWIVLLDNRDKRRKLFPKSYCAYETRKTFWLSIVTQMESITRCDDPPAYPIAK